MARPRARELTERELEIMHIFWGYDCVTAAEVRDALAERGRKLAYTTVATLVRILCEKGFVEQMTHDRPFQFCAARSFDDVSTRLIEDLVERVFGGSQEQLLLRLIGQLNITAQEKRLVEEMVCHEDES